MKNIISIDAGSNHSAILDNIGVLYTFGNNRCGQLGVGSYRDEFEPIPNKRITENVVQVSCGLEHTLVLTVGGKVYAMGSNINGQLGIKNKYHA